MLATISDYKHQVALIQNSGIQFLDFALKPNFSSELPGKFVRQTANGPLLRLLHNAETDTYWLPAPAGAQPERVKPESSIPLEHSLRLLNKIWLPLPFFRFNPPRTFLGGPDKSTRKHKIAIEEQCRIARAK